MAATLVRILDGNTFVVSDERGDIEASKTDPTGLFSYDTRFLSTWVLTVNDIRLNALSTDDLQYFEARFFLVPATGTVYIDPKLSVIRQRAVGDGFHEELTIISHNDEPADITVRLEAASDFADLFEIKDALPKMGTYDTRIDDGKLVLGYERETFKRETTITSSEPASVDEHGLTFTIRVEPHGTWTTDLDVVTSLVGIGVRMSADEVRPGEPQGQTQHAALPRRLDRRGASPRMRLGAAQVDVPAEPDRPRRAPLLAADRGRSEPAGGRPAVVHDDVRPGQHLHQPPGPAVPVGAGRDDAPRPRRLAGNADRRLPRRGPGPDPARDALRRDGRVRGAAALAVLRLGRCHAALRDPARRVRALDRRPGARPRSRARGPGRDQLDRRIRRPHGQRLHLVQAPQREDGSREPELEGLLELDLVRRRPAAGLPAGHVRAPGLCLRREGARRPAGPPRLERPGLRRQAGSRGRRPQAPLQPRLLAGRPGLLRARARRRRQPGRLARLEQRAAALERHRRRQQGQVRRRAPHGPAALVGLGRPDPGRGRGPLQPRRLPPRDGLAV